MLVYFIVRGDVAENRLISNPFYSHEGRERFGKQGTFFRICINLKKFNTYIPPSKDRQT